MLVKRVKISILSLCVWVLQLPGPALEEPTTPLQNVEWQGRCSTAARITCCARPSNDVETTSFVLTLAAQGLCFIST